MADTPQTLEMVRAQPCSAAEIEGLRQRWRVLHADLTNGEGRPFLIVTPLGLPLQDLVAGMLAQHSVEVVRRTPVASWPDTSSMLYARTDTDERLRVALVFERLWRAISLSEGAERWDLRRRDDLARLATLKHQFHQALGMVQVRVVAPDVTIRTPDGLVRLRALHVPDGDAVDRESQLLDAMTTAP
jgi:hypothetical protein